MNSFTIVRNGHTISVCRYPIGNSKAVYVMDCVRNADGHMVDLNATYDYEGYPVERQFPSMADGLHFMRQCVKNATH